MIQKLQERLQSVQKSSTKYFQILKEIRNIQAEVGSKRHERIQKIREEHRHKSKDPERRARERKKRQQYVQIPENQKKIKDYEKTEHYKELLLRNGQSKKSRKAVAEGISTDVHRLQRPKELASLDEINRIIAEYDFDKYKRNDADLYRAACQALSYYCLTNNCCAVCGCDSAKAYTCFKSVEDEPFIDKLKLCISFTKERRERMPERVQQDYCLKNYDERLEELILSRYGLYNSTGEPIDIDSFEAVPGLQLCICNVCLNEIYVNCKVKRTSRGAGSTIVKDVVNEAFLKECSKPKKHKRRRKRSRKDGVDASIEDSDDDMSVSEADECGSDVDSVWETDSDSDSNSNSDSDSDSESEPNHNDVTESSGAVVTSDANAMNVVTPPIRATCKPPRNAIANGNWIGYLPSEFADISRTEEQTVALMVPQIYLSTVVASSTGGKVINSHNFIIKNPHPILRSFSDDIVGFIRYTMVGAHVSIRAAMDRIRFMMRVDNARRFLAFLDSCNLAYLEEEHRLGDGLEETMELKNFIIDRSDASDNKVSRKLVRLMEFNTTSYHTEASKDEAVTPESQAERVHASSTSTDAARDGPSTRAESVSMEMDEVELDAKDLVEISHTHMLHQPFIPPIESNRKITDVIAFNTNNMPKKRGLGCMTYSFPTRIPYGCGGREEAREVSMSDIQWSLRFLRLHGEGGSRNSQHYGVLATIFDHIAMRKAFSNQFQSMRVKEEAITNFGLWKKEDVLAALQYTQEVEERERRGLAPHAIPENCKSLLSMVSMLRPGMSSMYGSDASRNSARHMGFGMTIRFGNPHVFYTITPDPAKNYILSINVSKMTDMTHVDIHINLSTLLLPDGNKRKENATSDPFQCAEYAKRVFDAFIEHILGWSIELAGPKKEGGLFGLIAWFHQACETQQDGVLHAHGVASIHGLPRTTAAMTEALSDAAFKQRFTAYIDAITPPAPYLATGTTHPNACPMEGCSGTLEALPFPGEAYCKRKLGEAAVDTSHCPECEAFFKHKDVLKRRVEAFAKAKNIDINPLLVEHYRCSPPELTEDGELSDRDLVYLALSLLDFQIHYESHSKSCFKITSRTPLGKLCRYLFPKLARLEQTCIDLESGKIESHRPIGCEYYNLCSLLWARLSKNNMDIQFLINGSSRRTTSYSTKYTFKIQRPSSILAMKIGLIGKVAKGYERTFAADDDDTITPAERGRRAINKSLWQLTKNQQLHLTIAAYMLINDGPFCASHKPVYVNLKQLCASFVDVVVRQASTVHQEHQEHHEAQDEYLDTDDDGDVEQLEDDEGDSKGEDESEGDEEQDDHDDDADASFKFSGSQASNHHYDNQRDRSEAIDPEDDDDENGVAEAGYVDIQIPNFALRLRDRDEDGSNKADRNEAVDFIENVCLMTDYWHRPTAMQDLNYASVIENYHIVRGKPPKALEMQGPHPNPEGKYWLRNKNHERKCISFVGGKGSQPPNLGKHSLTVNEREFYFKSMLLLFQPHDYTSKSLLEPHDSYEDAYNAFLDSNSSHAVEARIQAELLANYYENDAETVVQEGQSEEEQIFQNNPFSDPHNDPRFRPSDRQCCDDGDNDDPNQETSNIIAAMLEEGCDDDDIDNMFNFAREDTELPEPIQQLFHVTSDYHPKVLVPEYEADLPVFHNMEDYKKQLINPRDARFQNNAGVAMFKDWDVNRSVKIITLTEYFEPVPWTEPAPLPPPPCPDAASVPPTIASVIAASVKQLPRFASIKDISKAMRLNFWQHAVFETFARHLMRKFVVDIELSNDNIDAAEVLPPHASLKPQLIGYVGGIAGSGKSAVIASLLTFAQLWGRRDTVETMSFTGLASLNVEGNTVHTSRGLHPRTCEPQPNNNVVQSVRRIYLTIIDEVSMLGQKLCGAAECITRDIRFCQKPWGGIDIMLAGDFLQLPPVKALSITRAPTDLRGDTRYTWYLAAYTLFQQCNYVAFLTENMRQRDDKAFQDILERMHWGVNHQRDIDALNERCITNASFSFAQHFNQPHYDTPVEEYFSPVAISTNRERCSFNLENIYTFCKKESICVYEVLATSRRKANQAMIHRLKHSDDDFTDKVPFLFTFHTLAMPAMVTKRIDDLEGVKCIANGTLGFVIGFVHHNDKTACVAPGYLDDDSRFRLRWTADRNITVKRFVHSPAFIVFKVRGCDRQLVTGYPPGVVLIPLASYQAKFTLPGAEAETTMSVATFPLIPAYAMTPEKLQGVTLSYELYVSVLDARSPQIFYVVCSRVKVLLNLIFTQELTLEYIRKFLPPENIICTVKALLDRIEVPSYISPLQRKKFQEWRTTQRKYANLALQLHDERKRAKLLKRKLLTK